jgi:biopolymer transport protein ExbB/TolQ
MKCLKCTNVNPDAAVYCQRCGAHLSEGNQSEYFDLFKAFVLALLITAIFYEVFPLPVVRNEYVRELFEGSISELIFALSCWSLLIIFFKWLAHRRQIKTYRTFRHRELASSFAKGVFIKDVDERMLEISQFLEEQEVRKFQSSVIFLRVRRILHYLRAVPKKEEMHQILNYQAEIDYNRMQNGYTLLNVFIWAIPILGFIGTVFGIGQSVGDFSIFVRSMDGAALGGQMRSALGGVTSGLSVAFNTTFLALVCVIPIMLLSSLLRKSQEDLLLRIEEYCLEDLLPHLHVNPGDQELQRQTHEHLQRLNDFSENWLRRVAPVLESVTEHSRSLDTQVQGLQPLLKDFSSEVIRLQNSATPAPDETATLSSEKLP